LKQSAATIETEIAVIKFPKKAEKRIITRKIKVTIVAFEIFSLVSFTVIKMAEIDKSVNNIYFINNRYLSKYFFI
jgi:hypothetical protein